MKITKLRVVEMRNKANVIYEFAIEEQNGATWSRIGSFDFKDEAIEMAEDILDQIDEANHKRVCWTGESKGEYT